MKMKTTSSSGDETWRMDAEDSNSSSSSSLEAYNMRGDIDLNSPNPPSPPPHNTTDGMELLLAQVQRDAQHFHGLHDLTATSSYYVSEGADQAKAETSVSADSADGEPKPKKAKKGSKAALTNHTSKQISELKQNGQAIAEKHKKEKKTAEELQQGMAAKHEGKKQSKNKSGKKEKELRRRDARLEELKLRLQTKIEEIKARKSSGAVTTQEQKRLRRQEKKLNSRLKQKNKGHKAAPPPAVPEGLKSPQHGTITNTNGDVVSSKYDFSVISFGNDKKKGNLHGRDYQRLLAKVEKRNAKLEQLKEADPDKGEKMAQKIQWQTVMCKAQGEKVKDDPDMLKRAAKRKEKLKEKRKKDWGFRKKLEKNRMSDAQKKREKNIEKRKTDKQTKKKKQLIKRGRIIPGF